MNAYIATFHTHLAALKTHRTFTRCGIEARMAPVPRKISSSCGTCVFYSAADPSYDRLDADIEAVYRMENGNAELLKEFD